MIAALPMYDWPSNRAATDAFWAHWRDSLRARGLDAPEALDRETPSEKLWRDPALLLSQTCGYPYITALQDHVRLVATPCYDAPGCVGADYCSIVIARADHPAQALAELRGGVLAYNALDSQSGLHALKAALADIAGEGAFFSAGLCTGAHIGSIRAVAEGRADCAAIDAVCWALAMRDFPAVTGVLKEIARAPSAPGLPFITAKGRDETTVKIIHEALQDTLKAAQMAPFLREMRLCGAMELDATAYQRINRLALKAQSVTLWP